MKSKPKKPIPQDVLDIVAAGPPVGGPAGKTFTFQDGIGFVDNTQDCPQDVQELDKEAMRDMAPPTATGTTVRSEGVRSNRGFGRLHTLKPRSLLDNLKDPMVSGIVGVNKKA